MAFIRKNALVLTVTFTATDGTLTQPTAAYCVINYPTPSGNRTQVTQTLSFNSTTNTWGTVWDSSVAGKGVVSWVAYGTGALEAATQGDFELLANTANNT